MYGVLVKSKNSNIISQLAAPVFNKASSAALNSIPPPIVTVTQAFCLTAVFDLCWLM